MNDPIRRFDLGGSRPRPPAPAYLNSPVRSCDTCAHQRVEDWDGRHEHARCARFLLHCELAVRWPDHCSLELREWRAKPPPRPACRSLRQWLRDILFA